MQAEACSLKDGKHEGHPSIESLASGAFGFASKLADFVRTLVGASSSTLPLKFAYYINKNDSAQECLSMRSGRSMPAGAGRPVCDLVLASAGLEEKHVAEYLVEIMGISKADMWQAPHGPHQEEEASQSMIKSVVENSALN